MRWLFLFLLVLNIFYYVWHQQQTPPLAREVPSLALYQEPVAGIRLLDESSSEVRNVASQVAVPAIGEGEACLFLGGFEQEALAGSLAQRLTSLDIVAHVRSLETPVAVDYWVYLEPLASRQASMLQLRELQARKIDSYIITQGDLANGISLGIFPRLESAEGVIQRLRDAGYEAGMRELERSHRSYWVRVAPQARRLVDDTLLRALATDFPGLEQQLMPCESIASSL